MRSLVDGLSPESGWKTRWTVPSKPATIFDVHDSVVNAAAFGQPGATHAMFAAAMAPTGPRKTEPRKPSGV